MFGLVRLAGIVACVILIHPAPAADTATPPAVEQLVRDLGSPRFAVRDKATRALWKLGEKARPALTEAARGSDAEVARRAQEILDKFNSGILPGVSPDVLKQIRAFRSGNLDKQQAAITALVKLGEPAVPTLHALLTQPVAAANRPLLFGHLHTLLRREVPGLIVAGKLDQAEALLALNALGSSSGGLLDYAVFLHLRKHTKQAAAELEARKKAGGPTGEAAAVALVFVYRAAGDATKARAAAKALTETAPEPNEPDNVVNVRNLRDSLLEDVGAWAELAARPTEEANSAEGLKAFRLRLAGKTKEADAILDEQKTADANTGGLLIGAGGVDEATTALLLNDRPLEGIARLKQHHNAPHILADVLAARSQFQDALDLLNASKKVEAASGLNVPHLRQLYGTRKGRLLAQLGQRDAAAQVFTQLAEQIGGRDDYALTQLVRAEVRSGRYDLACEHLGDGLERRKRGGRDGLIGSRQSGFEVLFDADADVARFWWQTLRAAKREDESAGDTMRLVRALLGGTAKKADFDHAIKAASRSAAAPESRDGQDRALALATAYRAAGRADDAIRELSTVADAITKAKADDSEADTPARSVGQTARYWVFGIDERFRFWVELGDLLNEQGRHRDAATRLHDGWRLYPDNPLLLYLSGRALLLAGDAAQGRKRCDAAHWVALGNAAMRGRFLEELISRGYAADVRRERDLAREASWYSTGHVGNVWNQIARASAVLKDFDTAAAANRRAIHYLLRTPMVSYVEGSAYLTVPLGVRGYGARSLLAAGKVDEAVKQARECLTVTPGNVDLTMGLVAELDRRGRKAEADALFRRVWDAYAKLIADHPASGWARFSAAWLAAGCQRELAAALVHAKKAVELDPQLRSPKEALAEVHFRRGERDKALSLMKELAAANRHNHHYKRQLARYRTAAPSSPLPDAEDD